VLTYPGRRAARTDGPGRDGELAQALSELRLLKDDFEIARMEEAVAATVRAPAVAAPAC